MTIINPLPYTIANGDPVDATPVQVNLNQIVSNVNANAAAVTGNASQEFLVATTTNPAGAVPLAQMQGQFSAINPYLLPSGAIIDFGGVSAPTGFLLCDGSAVSRTTYSSLFSAIGVAWGSGDGSTTFNVPDFRRRTAIGSGGTVLSGPNNTVGSVGGEETHVLTTSELASHTHTDAGHSHSITDPGHFHAQESDTVLNQSGGSSYGGGSFGKYGGNTQSAVTGITGTNTANANIQSAGSNSAHNNMQPSAVVLKIIKT